MPICLCPCATLQSDGGKGCGKYLQKNLVSLVEVSRLAMVGKVPLESWHLHVYNRL